MTPDTVVRVRARKTDPETSHQAALEFEQDQTKAQRSVATVAEMILKHGPMTDFQIREYWPRFWIGSWSYTLPSKARHWARQAGIIKHVGFGQHQGRRVRLWGMGRDNEFLAPPELCPHCGHPMKPTKASA